MSKRSTTRKSFWKSFFETIFGFILGMILFVVVFIIGWEVTFHFAGEETREKMVSIEDSAKDKFSIWWGDLTNKDNEETTEGEITFEGAKLRDVSKGKLTKYIDFTIPYTWTIGEIEVNDAATEEAIAITGDNLLMSISLRSVELKPDAENIKWTEEGMLYELKGAYPDYQFAKANINANVASIVGVSEAQNAKLYVVNIPVEDKTVFVTCSFLGDDWNAELYFTTVISEMLEANK